MMTIVVEIGGGCVQNVYATEDNTDIRVLVVDRDTEYGSPSDLVEVGFEKGAELVYLSEYAVFGNDDAISVGLAYDTQV